jgi:hypothetical protein
MSSRKIIASTLAVLGLAAGLAWWALHAKKRERPAMAARDFARSVADRDGARLLAAATLPSSMTHLSQDEQQSRLLELLSSEISPEGVEALAAEGQFGPLADIFPDDAAAWTAPCGVSPAECVAFRMERDGLRAELVLHKSGDSYKIIRCNNVRQMAGEISQP